MWYLLDNYLYLYKFVISREVYMVFYITLVFFCMLCVSAASKVLSQSNFKKTLFDMGVPRAYIGLLAILIPLSELIIAGLLIIPMTQALAQWLLLCMFLIFTLAVGRAMATKKQADCNCFGSLSQEKLGWSTLIRLIILMALAVTLILLPDGSLFSLTPEELFYYIVSSAGIFAVYLLLLTIRTNIAINRDEVEA